jgi:hypothetical protein
MTDDRRGLDHLMEQNETELGFLSAYGGVDDGANSDGDAVLAALKRFLVAGGVRCEENAEGVHFAFGSASATEDGCSFTVHGDHLPLVRSDLHGSGFLRGELAHDRSSVSVVLTLWTMDQRRFVERLVEHHGHA